MREMDQFEQSPVVKGALEHVRQNFGLLYAGGRLAIDAGVVPWTPEQLLRVVATCWRRALNVHGQKKDALPKRNARFAPISSRKRSKCVGRRRRFRRGRRRVLCDGWRRQDLYGARCGRCGNGWDRPEAI